MELADDISYGIHDLEDAISLSLVKKAQWNNEVVHFIKDPLISYHLAASIDEHTSNLFSDNSKFRKKSISMLVHYFISSVDVRKRGVFDHDLLDYESYLPDLVKSELDFFKNFIQKNVIKLPEVQMLEYKGEQMIVKLFEALALNPTRLLPLKYKDRYENANTDSEKNRVICDYLAGTTDDYATKIYHKIFTPSSGSIFDKL